MRKQSFLFMMACLFAMSAWAADVSVTEKFTRVVQTGSSGANGSNWTGDVCGWETKFARRGTSDKLNGNQCTWLTLNGTDIRGYIKTTNLEGGIKAVSFKYGQFGTEASTVLKWHVSAEGISTISDIIERDGDLGGNTGTDGDSYSHQFFCKENAQLKILNMSEMDNGNMPASGKARLLVNNITITPYLLYRNKDVTVGLKQRGYVNNGSQDFINNTGSEGSIAFSSSNENVAIVDPETGVVTPVGVGDAVITATWSEGASTTYTLHVVDGIIAENFSKVVQTGQTTDATWHGDLFDWKVANVRRGEADTLGLNPRIQATAMRSNAGSTIISANPIEGGVKHLAFDWRQWASGTSPLTFKAYYSADKENWGDVVVIQEVEAATASTPHVFSEDIDNGAKGNAYLKLEYTSGAGVAVIGALKITPYLLYTTKAATLDTRNSLLYTNNDLINNTTGEAVVYSIAPDNVEGVSIDEAGQVTVTDETEGTFTVKATWGEVETTYALTVVSRTATTASYENAKVVLNLGAEVPANELTKTAGYDGTIAYASSNTAVATVTSEGVVSLAGGVGQATITATLPQTENYKAAEASYTLYVEDNSVSVQVEAFSQVATGSAATHAGTLWQGDVCAWRVSACGGVRKNTDKFASDQTRVGIWMGTPDPNTNFGSLTAENGVEGGIKHIWFYVEQPYNTGEVGYTLKPVVYLDEAVEANKVGAVEVVGATGDAIATNRKLFGASNVMKSNSVLIIRNESYQTSDGTRPGATSNRGRFLLDVIHITPYLLYTNKAHELYVGDTYTNQALINNTEGGTITYSLEDNDEEASIDPASGEVTALKAGVVTVKAAWSEGAYTIYTLTLLSKVVTEASYANSIMRVDLKTLAIVNTMAVTEGYDGQISYTSSNPAVATVSENGNVSLAGGVGQTTITATLPATDNYEAATASYVLYVRDEQARVEAFTGITGGVPSDADVHDWGGDLFMWQRQYQVRRSGNDTIHAGTDKHQATSIGVSTSPAAPSILQSKEPVEGGIKYLSFYWAQWGAANGCTRRITVYAGDEKIGEQENPNGTEGRTGEEFLLGINNAMKSNKQLIIKNESYKGTIETLADNASRIVLDNIYITPYLLYTNKDKQVLRIGENYKNNTLVNNTGDDATFASSDMAVATVAADGTVTAVGRGKATITATYAWSENEVVSTWYEVEVWPVNCETFSNEATSSTYAANDENAAGDKATWTVQLAGIKEGDFEPNVAFIRAPRQGEDKEAYLYSSPIAGGIGSMTFDWNLVAGEANTNWDIRVLVNGREVKRLGNSDLATEKMENFAQIIIEDINEPDNFVIRFENHSTINGTYTSGNKGRFVIDNITWTSYAGVKVLAEDANNEGWIRANGGQIVDVTISRSSLVANVWNTLCLPFAISKADDLGDAEVKEMTSVATEGDVLNIYFSDITGDELEAGKPYLVKPAADKNISGTYENKVIAMIASPVVQGIVTMQGLYSPMNVTKDDYNTLFVGTPDAEGNNLFYPQADGTLRGLRAYFKIGGAPLPAPRRARYVVTQKDVVTGIESVQNSDVRIQKIIRDGQLFIIHDGKMYNAQGQVIK